MAPTPEYESLYQLFPDGDGIPSAESVTATEMPEPYRSLLVHNHHMTVTVERFYADTVDVKVIESRTDFGFYCRKILLTLTHTGRVVQLGIVRINLSLLAPIVREQIVEEKTPLGRVLIQNEVLREVQPTGFVSVKPDRQLCDWFKTSASTTLYGRLGIIHTDGKPAIEVLEVLAPVPEELKSRPI